MLVEDLHPYEILAGMRIRSLSDKKIGIIKEIDFDDGCYAYVQWEGEGENFFGGFWWNDCKCEVISIPTPNTLDRVRLFVLCKILSPIQRKIFSIINNTKPGAKKSAVLCSVNDVLVGLIRRLAKKNNAYAI